MLCIQNDCVLKHFNISLPIELPVHEICVGGNDGFYITWSHRRHNNDDKTGVLLLSVCTNTGEVTIFDMQNHCEYYPDEAYNTRKSEYTTYDSIEEAKPILINELAVKYNEE